MAYWRGSVNSSLLSLALHVERDARTFGSHFKAVKLGVTKALSEDAGEGLSALGFHLDMLKIQNVRDD